jgi:hypothetical protein
VLLQTGVAYVSTERINNLCRVILLGMDNAEWRARRGKSWRKMPVALCVIIFPAAQCNSTEEPNTSIVLLLLLLPRTVCDCPGLSIL